jgi:homoserine kinase
VDVRVSSPASTANLGPGFDCFGAALSWRLDVTISPGGDDDGGLIGKAVRAVAPEAGRLTVTTERGIAVGRGLGSSGAAIAAGLVAGCVIGGRDPDPAELLELGLPLEGHPDNLAASLYGGLTLVVAHRVLRMEPSAALRPGLLVPDGALATSKARKALPAHVPYADAVANLAAASGLLAVLTGLAEPTRSNLLACTEDRLHQPYRAELMPESARAIETLRRAGVAAFLSGAGPSVCALLTDETQGSFEGVAASLPGWEPSVLAWEPTGAHAV